VLIDCAFSSAALNLSGVDTSGFAAPLFTATPKPIRAMRA
jgi:hypothetical protein